MRKLPILALCLLAMICLAVPVSAEDPDPAPAGEKTPFEGVWYLCAMETDSVRVETADSDFLFDRMITMEFGKDTVIFRDRGVAVWEAPWEMTGDASLIIHRSFGDQRVTLAADGTLRAEEDAFLDDPDERLRFIRTDVYSQERPARTDAGVDPAEQYLGAWRLTGFRFSERDDYTAAEGTLEVTRDAVILRTGLSGEPLTWRGLGTDPDGRLLARDEEGSVSLRIVSEGGVNPLILTMTTEGMTADFRFLRADAEETAPGEDEPPEEETRTRYSYFTSFTEQMTGE